MNITDQNIIGEVVAQDYRTASVFKNYGIDFCCNGNRTIKDACESENVAINKLLEDLQLKLQENTNATVNYNSWPLDLMADYVEKKHHRYVEEKIQEITTFLNKIVRVHGERHPELIEIEKLFQETTGELTAHMKKEELILFPFIRNLVKAQNNKETIVPPAFGSVQNPVAMMMQDHDNEGIRFRKIASLSQNYTPPSDACNTYRVTYAMLKEFEEDLHLHIHLENNILFPKAIELEKTLLQ